MVFKKHGAKVFFGVACFLLVLSLCFSAYSYARYVSHVDANGGTAGTATIDCDFTVNNNGNGVFINAPFMQKVTENTQPVRMNSWAESMITVNNQGPVSGLQYEYSFVFYLPKGFAECAMFQLVELKNPEGSRDDETALRLAEAKKASELYRMDPASLSLVTVTHTDAGVPIANDYRELIDAGMELGIDTVGSSAVLQENPVSALMTGTFATYYKDETQAEHFVTPIAITDSTDFQFYRITVNLSLTENPAEYVLRGGDAHSFLFRLVLREARDTSLFENTLWNPAVMWETSENADGSLTYIRPLEAKMPTVDEGYECRWATDGEGNYLFDETSGEPLLQIAEKATGAWQTVSVRSCVGFTSPSRVAIVFTQRS